MSPWDDRLPVLHGDHHLAPGGIGLQPDERRLVYRGGHQDLGLDLADVIYDSEPYPDSRPRRPHTATTHQEDR